MTAEGTPVAHPALAAIRVRTEPAATAAQAFPADDLDAMIARAEGTLDRLLERGMPVCVSWSAGKDSSTVLNLLLSVAAQRAQRGAVSPPIVITHADTLIESPEMVAYAHGEMAQVRAFAATHRLDVSIEISKPNLADSWAVRCLGGRALPSFPGTNRDCSTSWKVLPMQRLRKKVLRRLREHCAQDAQREPVVLLGTRYDESTVRGANMAERGESDIEIRRGVDANGKPSHLFLSPIAHWTSDDVWGYLGLARAKEIHAYSGFEDTFRVYADAMGTSCVIVAEDMAKARKASKACGARHGCSLCTAVGKDQSMENMLSGESAERYAYMRGLNQLRNFLLATRWDMDRRAWLGRTINEGYVKIAPDAYSPSMIEELLRYSLSLDVLEQEAAARAGVAPRFQLVDAPALLAIDAMWSLQAFHRPFHALAIYNEIYNEGKRYPVPQVETFARPILQEPRYLWVGPDWDNGRTWDLTGLRSIELEMVRHDGDGCMGTRALPNDKTVLDVNNSEVFAIDAESAYLILELELPELLRRHADEKTYPPTHGYLYYAQMGALSVRAGKEGEIDQMLRRSSFKSRHGLAGAVQIATLLNRSVSAAEAGFKAATNGKVRARGAAGSRSTLFEDLSGEPTTDDVAAPRRRAP